MVESGHILKSCKMVRTSHAKYPSFSLSPIVQLYRRFIFAIMLRKMKRDGSRVC